LLICLKQHIVISLNSFFQFDHGDKFAETVVFFPCEKQKDGRFGINTKGHRNFRIYF
jgi:hypothetical protein